MNRTVVRIAGALATLVAAYAAASMGHMARVIVGAGVGLPSFILMVISRRQLGASFAITPEAKSLVTTGLYSHIQHPMYLFLDLLLVALIVSFGLRLLLPVWAVIVAIQMLQAGREEKVLAEAFTGEYKAYARRLWV